MPEKRSVTLSGHRTSVSLEPEFWKVLGDIAKARGWSVNHLISDIDRTRTGNLSSALRIFVLKEVQASGSGGNSHRPE